jgi:hypothetical protein
MTSNMSENTDLVSWQSAVQAAATTQIMQPSTNVALDRFVFCGK